MEGFRDGCFMFIMFFAAAVIAVISSDLLKKWIEKK
jgi:hypothetical protein